MEVYLQLLRQRQVTARDWHGVQQRSTFTAVTLSCS